MSPHGPKQGPSTEKGRGENHAITTLTVSGKTLNPEDTEPSANPSTRRKGLTNHPQKAKSYTEVSGWEKAAEHAPPPPKPAGNP